MACINYSISSRGPEICVYQALICRPLKYFDKTEAYYDLFILL